MRDGPVSQLNQTTKAAQAQTQWMKQAAAAAARGGAGAKHSPFPRSSEGSGVRRISGVRSGGSNSSGGGGGGGAMRVVGPVEGEPLVDDGTWLQSGGGGVPGDGMMDRPMSDAAKAIHARYEEEERRAAARDKAALRNGSKARQRRKREERRAKKRADRRVREERRRERKQELRAEREKARLERKERTDKDKVLDKKVEAAMDKGDLDGVKKVWLVKKKKQERRRAGLPSDSESEGGSDSDSDNSDVEVLRGHDDENDEEVEARAQDGKFVGDMYVFAAKGLPKVDWNFFSKGSIDSYLMIEWDGAYIKPKKAVQRAKIWMLRDVSSAKY